MSWECTGWPPNNSLERTRLACGKLEYALPAELRENESSVGRAAGQLAHRAAHLHRTCGAPQVQVSRSSRPLGSYVQFVFGLLIVCD